jgi:hypothetical protein
MPALPTPGDVHVNRPLTNMSIAYMQKAEQFIADKASPMVPVVKQSDSYFIWSAADFNTDDAGERGPGAEVLLTDARLSTDSYNCKVFASGKLISEQELANQDEPLNLDRTSAELVMNKLLIRRERQWQNTVFKLGVWTGSTTGTDLVGGTYAPLWDPTAVSSEPILNLMAQIVNMEKTPGVTRKEIDLIVGAELWNALENHPKLLERIEFVQVAIASPALLASVLGIRRVLVARATYNSAAKFATASFGFVHGKSALLLCTPNSPGINVPSATYGFTWTGLYGAENSGVRMKKYWRDVKASWQLEGETAFDFKVIAPTLGVFFSIFCT